MTTRATDRVTPMRIRAVVLTVLCTRALGHVPTAAEMAAWSRREPEIFREPMTVAQAQHVLDHPEEVLP